MSAAMLAALKWLRNRNGDGVFDRNQVLVSACERAPVMRATWNKLEAAGAVEFYLDRRRLRVTEAGRRVDVSKVEESA
ncbi:MULTISPECIES: hypothetical protein [unclassified Mesorhizobium]|uniref:hypothetical protein n=1 Tax=unclassified Mesorhizobium TaxID=325217 RepID=UPI00112C30AD|nr:MULTISPECIES: hypothetical protein [unclassified Mesorhizobium]MCA0027364.1 hypothetical protein [Mesorhizobium sp. B263B1A]TPJ98638.1 hypothetical protein FJ489_06840 [Mesorhizobium sp. B2-5-12]TPK28801.1 hypothetical protein FJ562_00230 [Mesorhizobium sp. B2-5-6]TPN16214.1 hypothetical protein FJ973_05855 [Mesorhizobium sp. B2-1-3]